MTYTNTPTPTEYPATAAIWPQVDLAAMQRKLSGAVRTWELARALDPQGSGIVSRTRLLSLLQQLGTARRTRYRWLKVSIAAGFLTPVRDGERLRITGLEKVARMLGLQQVGWRVIIPSDELVGSGWKAMVWAAYLTRYKDRPVSRAVLEEHSGVKRRTQVNIEQDSEIGREKNFAVDPRRPSEQLEMYREIEGRQYAFTVNYYRSGAIAYQRPNAYHAPKSVLPDGGMYRASEISRNLREMSADVSEITESFCHSTRAVSVFGRSSLPSKHGDAVRGGPRRRYFDDYKPMRRAVKKLARSGKHGEELYEKLKGGLNRKHRSRKSGWWLVEAV